MHVQFIVFVNLMGIFVMSNAIVICRKNSWKLKSALILDS